MGWIRLATAQAMDLIQAILRDIKEVECFFGGDLYIKLRGVGDTEPELHQVAGLINVAEHCDRLAKLLLEIEEAVSQPHTPDQEISWLDASDWLHVASSIDHVHVDTSRFDESVMWCRPDWEFESQRNLLLSQFVTRLTIFNFVWGSFESVVKLIDPPKVPKSIKPGRTSFVDRAVFYLKNRLESTPQLRLYEPVIADFRETLSKLPQYGDLLKEFRIQSFVNVSGIGIHVVRKIRNKFAHGVSSLPFPEDWGENSSLVSLDVHLIEASTRIVLFTIQMLLLVYLKDEHFLVEVTWCVGENGLPRDEAIDMVLATLHIRSQNSGMGENQLPLF